MTTVRDTVAASAPERSPSLQRLRPWLPLILALVAAIVLGIGLALAAMALVDDQWRAENAHLTPASFFQSPQSVLLSRSL